MNIRLDKQVAKTFIEILEENDRTFASIGQPNYDSGLYKSGIRLEFSLSQVEYRIYADGSYKERQLEWK